MSETSKKPEPITRRFDESTIGVVHQTGQALTERQKGVNVTLHFSDAGLPQYAEVFSDDSAHYAEVGLQVHVVDGVRYLDGYDGVFDIPKEIITMLRELQPPVKVPSWISEDEVDETP